MKINSTKRHRVYCIGIIALGVILLVGIIWFWHSQYNVVPQMVASITENRADEPDFPEVDESTLTETQHQLVVLLRQEYKAQHPGEYYSQGETQAWCANFVSWVMHEIGQPLNNPYTNDWRIPGTYTLREYYEKQGKFRTVDSDYQPTVGDVILYDNPGPFGQHVNFVVSNKDGLVTTVGGNENNRIRVQEFRLSDMQGMVGFGLL